MSAWVDRLLPSLAVYVAAGVLLMLTGIGDAGFSHYFALLSDAPASVAAVIITAIVARREPPGPSRTAWLLLTATILLYGVGSLISMVSWLRGIDPFPGIADIFFLAFFPVLFCSVFYFIRAAAGRVPWFQLCLDAAIFMVGFGAFFWFLVIRPTTSNTQMDVIKQSLSQIYLALNCIALLLLGVPVLSSGARPGARRVPLLLLAGFAIMFLGDIIWSLMKIRGLYLPGGLQDVLYLVWYLPIALAGREQLRKAATPAAAASPGDDTVAQMLPYVAMLTSLVVLVYLARADMSGPVIVMMMIVFTLTVLVIARQAMVLREQAQVRERIAAQRVEDLYASLIANASDAIMIVSAAGELKFASPASERTLGLRPEDAAGRNLLQLWAGEDAERLRMFLAEVAASSAGMVGPVELRIERDRVRFVLEIVGSNLTRDSAVQGLALNFRDISERKSLEEQLRQLAFHDPLTLLANRNLFRDRVQHALAIAQRDGTEVTVMFLDLDNFKNVNDSLGHDVGDRLLQAVAQRLVKTTRPTDTVSRLGGDEFAVLLEAVATREEVESLAGALIRALDESFSLGEARVKVATSIGIASSRSAADAEELLSNADIAMYHAKSAGKGCYVLFQAEMQEKLHRRLQLEADMAGGLANQEFFLEYQPIIDLGTRCLLGVEALVRWHHPTAGVLAPGQFIPVAEESGQIVALGRWVLTNACVDLCRWRDSMPGGSGLRIAVNISAQHLQHGDLAQDVADALAISGLEAGNLVIELTESTIMYNSDANLDKLCRLKALGVRLAIDDFGTGYSSLSYLHRFPIDILKIDRSFVNRLTNSDNGSELARAVITLSETLGLDTVAEGIEFEPQVAALLDLGCVAGQGYLFARPTSLEGLSTSVFVANRSAHWTVQTQFEAFTATGRFKALRAAGPRGNVA
ncbi:MAG: EAL domain-containing protein [Proteobacteria bacterium]|nr:EAL domain-containing protein [Pseudomonadota bacterium]